MMRMRLLLIDGIVFPLFADEDKGAAAQAFPGETSCNAAFHVGGDMQRPATLSRHRRFAIVSLPLPRAVKAPILNGEIGDFGALAELCDQPIRLASAARPGLRLVVRIDEFGGARFTATAAAEQLVHRKAPLFGELRQCLLYFGALAVARGADCLLNLALQFEQILSDILSTLGVAIRRSFLLIHAGNLPITDFYDSLNYFLPSICQAGQKDIVLDLLLASVRQRNRNEYKSAILAISARLCATGKPIQ